MKPKPPKTKRICINCEKFTTFTYNKSIGHSECAECGYRFASKTVEDYEELYGPFTKEGSALDRLKKQIRNTHMAKNALDNQFKKTISMINEMIK